MDLQQRVAMIAICPRTDCAVFAPEVEYAHWSDPPYNNICVHTYNKDGSVAHEPVIDQHAWRCSNCGHCWNELVFCDGTSVISYPAALPAGALGLTTEAPIVAPLILPEASLVLTGELATAVHLEHYDFVVPDAALALVGEGPTLTQLHSPVIEPGVLSLIGTPPFTAMTPIG